MNWHIPTERGDIPVVADDENHSTVVILAHGAGSHMEHKTLEWLSGLVARASSPRSLASHMVIRFNFLYRAQGKSMPDRMPVLIETYRAVIASVREKVRPDKLIIGGHSMGGRVASMLEAESKTADGLLLFGYPLHPPGQPEKLRDAHLSAIRTRTLQISGTADEFCTPEIMERVVATLDPNRWKLKWVEGADHSYGVKKSSGRTRKDAEVDIQAALEGWL